ncbi:PEGA domain-containing protein [Sorangium sp. So ce1389]|uniref:PEGA domain-containing protein n=1 Tax=Sorangium sp. So ce1389 TaxID=3133336 RepID=UPI003F60D520
MRLVAPSLFVCAALGAATGFTSPARADDIYPLPARSDASTVKDLVRRGQRARAAGRWTEALAAYKAALDATGATSSTDRQRAEIAGELGFCELALRRYRDAAEHLAWSLERREALPVALQARLEEGLRKAASHVGTLFLSVDPPDAEVLIDGNPAGAPAPTYRIFLEPGRHMVRARSTGQEEAFQSFDVQAGNETSIAIQVRRAAVSRADHGALAGPATKAALDPRTQGAPRAPTPWASWPGTLRIGGVALTTASAAAGAVFLLRAHVLHGDIREGAVARRAQGWTSYTCREGSAPAACDDIQGQIRERNLFATLGKVSLAASGAFGLATAASFLTEIALSGARPATGGLRVVPVTTGEQAGVVLLGAW